MKKRYYLIDALRGISIINMIIFHYLYDYMEVLGNGRGWYNTAPAHIWQQYICISFILISGFSWSFSKKNNLKRGIIINLFGILITIVTALAVPGEFIFFGILSFMGCSILITMVLDRFLAKINPVIGFITAILIFILTRHINSGVLGAGILSIHLPYSLYNTDGIGSYLAAAVGFPGRNFYSSDYFSLLPWFFLFLAGFFLYGYVQTKEELQRILTRQIPVVTKIGQKSLLIYILHQPVCMLVSIIVDKVL